MRAKTRCEGRKLIKRKEGDADRRRHFQARTCRRERAGLLVDAKRDDFVGELVLSEQIVAGGIDREVPRFFAAGSHIRCQAQQAATVDLEHGDAVKTAVWGVDEFATRMQSDFRSVVAARE